MVGYGYRRSTNFKTDLSAVHVAGVEQIEGQCCDQIYEEPTFDVVQSYALAVAHHLAFPAHVCRPEVQYDVCKGQK